MIFGNVSNTSEIIKSFIGLLIYKQISCTISISHGFGACEVHWSLQEETLHPKVADTQHVFNTTLRNFFIAFSLFWCFTNKESKFINFYIEFWQILRVCYNLNQQFPNCEVMYNITSTRNNRMQIYKITEIICIQKLLENQFFWIHLIMYPRQTDSSRYSNIFQQKIHLS